MQKGQILRIKINHLAPDGNGYAVVEGRTVPVKGALPGDEVDVCVRSLRRFSARVSLESIVSSEIQRIQPKCPHFSRCGGCIWQDVPYDVQCRLKKLLVGVALSGLCGVELPNDIGFRPSPDIFFYRNKMEFSFDEPPQTGSLVLGLHESSRYDRVFDVTTCHLQSELSNRAVLLTRDFACRHGLKAYGIKSHEGLLRFLVVRDGKSTGEAMINLVTSGEEFKQIHDFCNCLVKEIPEITTVLRTINRRLGSVASGGEREILFGDGFIRERVGDYLFTISPDAFFQTNTHQTKQLYDTIREFSRLTGKERLLDLYCGTGTIGIYLAEKAAEVTGVELVPDAVRDSERNAHLNGVGNISFIAGQAERIVNESMDNFDVILCDPPRAGIHPKVMSWLVRMRIPRMIYVSCNVRAIPGDLETLVMAGYRVKDVRVFDMAPHTRHIETVLLLEIE